MMTPRERVLAALAHQQPDRVPFSWGFGPTPEMAETLRRDLAGRGLDWDALRAETEDIIRVFPAYIGPTLEGDPHLAIWGIHVKSIEYGGGAYEEFTEFPLGGVEDPPTLESHPWPDAGWYDYGGLRAQIVSANPRRQRAVQVLGGNPFELYSWMTGLEEAMVNLKNNPGLVKAALDRITAFLEERTRRILEVAGDQIDLVFLADDLAGQSGLLMSPDTYRQVLQPFHWRLTNCVHQCAPDVRCIYHTDGAVFDIVPDLLDAGMDVLEAVQTDATGMDPARLKGTYGHRLSFHGGISVQQLLPQGDAVTVERECRRLAQVLGNHGGYIAAPSHAIQVGTPTENVLAMLRAFSIPAIRSGDMNALYL